MKELNIQIKKVITTGCELWVETTLNEVPEGVMYFEFLEGDGLDTWTTRKVSEMPSLYKQKLHDDGLFMYYCLEVEVKSSLEAKNVDKFAERAYCEQDANGNWILWNGLQKVDDTEKLNILLENYTKDDISMIREDVFSICRLHQCLENKLRSYIFGVLKTCGEYPECNKNTQEDYLRNFLFSTVFILRQLICQKRFAEALRILESINNCEGICKDTRSSSNDCGCCK